MKSILSSYHYFSQNFQWRRACSTSYPSGNQVDGSPLVAIRKQWLSRADLGPHKMMNQRENLASYRCFARWHDKKCLGFVVERMLKININVIICKKANASAGSMRSQISRNFEKMRIFNKISRFFSNFLNFSKKKDKTIEDWRGTLRVSVRKLGWRFTARLPYGNSG